MLCTKIIETTRSEFVEIDDFSENKIRLVVKMSNKNDKLRLIHKLGELNDQILAHF